MKTEEKRLILELCKFKTQNKSNLISFINDGHASSSVLGELFFNRMAGVAYGVLKDTGLLGKVNREFRNSLYNAYLQNIERNKSFSKCLKYLSGILQKAEKEYVMLKGAYLCSAYPNGYRTSNDIDLLVNQKSVTKIEKILLADGFQQGNIRNGSFIPADRREIIASKMSRGETVPFIKEVNLPFMKYLEVDINFSLGFTGDDGKAVKDIIDSAKSIEIEGASICIPCKKHFFIHLCSHLWKEASTYPWVKMKRDMSLYKYCDIYMIMYELSIDTIDEIVECAKKYNVLNECYCALIQTKELFCEDNYSYDILIKKLDVQNDEIADIVISPEEKKLYKYIEKSVIERLFYHDRSKLLEEVAEWIP